MTLSDIISQVGSFNGEDTIYAVIPWAPDSEAVVATEPDDGGIPNPAAKINAQYFLELFLVNDFLDDWLASLDHQPSIKEQCMRLIQYAENDA